MTDDDRRPDVAGWTDEFIDRVFTSEYQTILERRREVLRRAAEDPDPDDSPPPKTAPIPDAPTSADAPPRPSTRLGLFGLAFSGGGIRSATFNLGIIQALAKNGLLGRFDYLSTVSGGGFIGSCLSSLLNRPDADVRWTSRFPFYLESGRQEPLALRHLRNHSNYLVPGGVLGYVVIAAVLLRGILINILATTPFITAVVALTHLTYGERLSSGIRQGLPWFALTEVAAALFAAAVLAYPVLSWWASHGPKPPPLPARRRVAGTYAVLLGVVLGCALFESLPLVLRWYHHGTSGTVLEGVTWASLLAAITSGNGGSDNEDPGPMRTMLDVGKLVVAAAAGPLLMLLFYLAIARWVIYPGSSPMSPAVTPWVVYGLGVVVLAYTALFLDTNMTSIHNFYRDRLSRAYLFQVAPSWPDAVAHTDALPMSQLNAEGTVAPYHLVNTTLNLQGCDDTDLRGRQADFFVFSKHYVGSIRTGYVPTTDMEAADRHINLGTAVAISGAAASPGMGTMTIRSITLLMVLLNIRLGYWLVHPQRAATKKTGLLHNLGAGVRQLLSEALATESADGPTVNVSDGGHIENLAIYELLRRRCRVIVCGDGEADPDLSFHGLATVVRYAATDMGVHIDIDLEGLAKDEDGRSHKHHAIGRIDYGDGEIGWLLYIKLSIGPHELPYIEQYRHEHPDFPHQSTGDQFFDEAQFEAYRALGFKVGLRSLTALTTLEQAAEDEGLLEFSGPEVGSVPETTPPSGTELVEHNLSRHFQSAADPEPPW